MTRPDPVDRRGAAWDEGGPAAGDDGRGATWDEGGPAAGDDGGGPASDGRRPDDRADGSDPGDAPGGDGDLHVYTGNGKGKTSAAFGAALRAVGHGWRAHVVQFMKGDPYPDYGEVVAARAIDGLTVEQHPVRHLVDPDDVRESDREAAEEALAASRDALSARAADDTGGADAEAERPDDGSRDAGRGATASAAGAGSPAGRERDARYDLVVLDEVNVACHFGLVEGEEVAAMLADRRAPYAVCTGRYAPEALVAAADCVTRMEAVRHPRPEGPALEGIDR